MPPIMNRRNFISTSAIGAALSAAQTSAKAATTGPAADYQPKKAVMKLGCQSAPATDKRLQFFKRHSVNNISADTPRAEGEGLGYPTVEELSQLRERAEKAGISVDMFTPPFLASSHIDNTRRPAIMLGQSPERDKDIDDIH